MTRLVRVRVLCDGCNKGQAIFFIVERRLSLCEYCDTLAQSEGGVRTRIDLRRANTALPFCDDCDRGPAIRFCEMKGLALCAKCELHKHSECKRHVGILETLQKRTTFLVRKERGGVSGPNRGAEAISRKGKPRKKRIRSIAKEEEVAEGPLRDGSDTLLNPKASPFPSPTSCSDMPPENLSSLMDIEATTDLLQDTSIKPEPDGDTSLTKERSLRPSRFSWSSMLPMADTASQRNDIADEYLNMSTFPNNFGDSNTMLPSADPLGEKLNLGVHNFKQEVDVINEPSPVTDNLLLNPEFEFRPSSLEAIPMPPAVETQPVPQQIHGATATRDISPCGPTPDLSIDRLTPKPKAKAPTGSTRRRRQRRGNGPLMKRQRTRQAKHRRPLKQMSKKEPVLAGGIQPTNYHGHHPQTCDRLGAAMLNEYQNEQPAQETSLMNGFHRISESHRWMSQDTSTKLMNNEETVQRASQLRNTVGLLSVEPNGMEPNNLEEILNLPRNLSLGNFDLSSLGLFNASQQMRSGAPDTPEPLEVLNATAQETASRYLPARRYSIGAQRSYEIPTSK